MEQKLGRVGDVHLRNAVLVVAQPALEEAFLEFTIDIVSIMVIHRELGKELTQSASSSRSHRKYGHGKDQRHRKGVP